MKLITKLTLISLLLINGLFAQENEFSILRDKIEKATTIEDKIERIRDVSYKYFEQQVYYDSAFYYAKMAQEEAVKNNKNVFVAKAIFDQAMIFYEVGDHEKALEYYEKSAQISLDNNTNIGAAHSYVNIGVIYADVYNNYDKALEYYKKVLVISKQEKDDKLSAYALVNIGDQHLKKEEYTLAIEHIEKGNKLFELIGEETSESKLLFAGAHFKLNNNELAKKSALQALDLANKEKRLTSIYEASILLRNILKEEEDYKSSLDFAEKALIYKDSIIKSKELNEIEKLQLNFKIKEQNTQLKNLAITNKYLNTIYIVVALAVIFLIFLISRQLKIIRMTKDIHDIQNRLIKPELEKREQTSYTSFEAAKSQDEEIL